MTEVDIADIIAEQIKKRYGLNNNRSSNTGDNLQNPLRDTQVEPKTPKRSPTDEVNYRVTKDSRVIIESDIPGQ